MAKGKDKKDKKGKKGKKKHDTEDSQKTGTDTELEKLLPVETILPPDIRTINITLEGFRNIVPTFPVTDLSVDAKYLENNLGTSPKFPATDDEIVRAHHTFLLEVDINNPKQIDDLISNPIVFTITETPGILTEAIEADPVPSPIPTMAQNYYGLSLESALDLFESFTGEKVDQSTFVKSDPEAEETEGVKKKKEKKKKEKGDKGKKRKKSPSKSKVKDTAQKTSAAAAIPPLPSEPVVLGTATLDLLGVFLGLENIQETLTIYPMFRYFDERMVPCKSLPRLVINVTIDADWHLMDVKLSNIICLTVESLYNVPEVMAPEMDYKVCTQLPILKPTMGSVPVVLSEGKYKKERDIIRSKFWPGMPKSEDARSATKYRIEESTASIRNRTDTDVEVALTTDAPRIEWNLIKRSYFGEDNYISFIEQVKKYRGLPLEIYCTPSGARDNTTVHDTETKSSKSKGKDKTSMKSSKGSSKVPKTTTPAKTADFLHLMAIIDVSALLHPGVTKVRVACPVTTYHEQEIQKGAGLENSFFRPRPPPPPQSEKSDKKKGKKEKKGKKGGKKSSKSSKSSKGSKKDKGSKGSKGKGKGSKSSKGSKKSKGSKGSKGKKNDDEGNDLAKLLPPAPVPEIIEPSVKVYNESGKRTFVLVEVELMRSIVEKRELVDLSDELQDMLPEKPELPKLVISARVAGHLYRTTIRALTENINKQYLEYIKELDKCACPGCPETGLTTQMDFLSYLRRVGAYQNYLASLTKATTSIVNDRFRYQGECDLKNKEYQNYISEVFVYLISKMNEVLNEIEMYGIEQEPAESLRSLDPLLLYAKEASELCADVLSDKYYLERIALDERNADCWFDYAIFCLELREPERAMECVRTALAINAEHRYCLLMYGILLDEKDQYEAAETCFSKVMMENPKWMEGWGTFLFFYKRRQNIDGEELCLEMAKKYIGYRPSAKDAFMQIDDLAWTMTVCPNDVYHRTTAMLVKMRCFLYAECALACCVSIANTGITDYLAGVICYYRGQHEHALRHLKRAEELYGLDYATASLKGHVSLSIGLVKEAKEAYSIVLQSFNRPDDIHLVYVNMAVVMECLKDTQEARKILLLACKYSPTPYTWLATGLLYYKQRDLLSAEACLTEANMCDNRLPEIWAYLTLINVQLERIDEAELCYRHALKNKLTNIELLEKIKQAVEGVRKEFSDPSEFCS